MRIVRNIPLILYSVLLILSNGTVIANNNNTVDYLDTQSFNETSIEIDDDIAFVYFRDKIVSREDSNVLPRCFSIFASNSTDRKTVVYVTCNNMAMTNPTLKFVNMETGINTNINLFGKILYPTPMAWSAEGELILVLTVEKKLSLCRISRDTYKLEEIGSFAELTAELFTGICPENLGFKNDKIVFRDYRKDLEFLLDPITGSITSNSLTYRPQSVMSALETDAKTSLPCPVPALSQNDPRWAGDPLNGCTGLTIGSHGCALTSTASVFQYCSGSYNPDQLNSCLGSSYACPLHWSIAAQSCHGGADVSGGQIIGSFDYDLVDTMLEEGDPVIARGWSGNDYHFFIITGGSGQYPSGYTIMDAWNGTHKSLATYLPLSGIRRFWTTPDCSQSCSNDLVYDYCTDSYPWQCKPITSSHPYAGCIATPGDEDFFYFYAVSGQEVNLHAYPASGSDAICQIAVFKTDCNTRVAEDPHNPDENYEDAVIDYTVTQSGMYRIKIRSWGDTTGAYIFEKSCIDDLDQDGPYSISVDDSVTDYYTFVHYANDVDWYKFSASTIRNYDFRSFSRNSDTYNSDLDPSWPDFALQMAIYASPEDETALVVSPDNEDYSEKDASITNWVPPYNGDFYLKIRGYDAESGYYKLRTDWDENEYTPTPVPPTRTPTRTPTRSPTPVPPTHTPTPHPTYTPTQNPVGLRVPADYDTIQMAIDAANSGETVLVSSGTYSGAGNVSLDFNGKMITVKSTHGADSCVIDCEDYGRGFYFHNNETNQAVIQGFTIQNAGNRGIYCINSSPTIRACRFINNYGSSGGGMYCSNSDVIIEDCTFSQNQAAYAYCGGGIHFNNCNAPRVFNCDFIENTASGGGAIVFVRSTAEIIHCRFIGNTIDFNGGSGGAIFCSQASHPMFFNCLFAGNTGYWGGVLSCNESSAPTFTQCTFAENEALYDGGGIWVAGSSEPHVLNSIIWGNIPNSIDENDDATVHITYSDIEDGHTGTGNIQLDPLFVSIGPDDYFLSQIASFESIDSPCVNTGSNLAASICSTVQLHKITESFCMDELTTRSDRITDIEATDMGYHYFFDNCSTPTPFQTHTPSPVPTHTPIPPTHTPVPTATPTRTPTPTETPIPTATPSPTPFPGDKGDIDLNEAIDTFDALLAFRISLNLYTANAEELFRSDVDLDGFTTSSDALCIFQQALGLTNICFE